MSTAPAETPVVARPRVAWAAVAAYVLLACGLAWLVALPLWLGDGMRSPLFTPLAAVMMLTPAISAIVVTFAFRMPRTARLRFLGMWPLRPAGRFVLFMLLGLFVPIVIVFATMFIAAALGLVSLDLVGFSGFAAQLAALAPGKALPPVGVLVAVQLVAIVPGVIFNSIFAFGEELGWRGWLQSALMPLGPWPAMLLTGVVWGLWHSPLILLGYDFGRRDVTGVLFMIGGCVAWGVLLGWLRMRSASVWPAAIAHGSLNSVAGLVLLFAAAGTAPDMALVGPLGVIAVVVVALVVAVVVLLRQFRPGAQAAPSVPAAAAASAPALEESPRD